MRISELSRTSGVTIPTIKFYLREGLLSRGTATARTQAEYSDDHLRRLQLIRTLTDIGGRSIRQARTVLDSVDDERVSTHELLGVALRAVGTPADAEPGPGPTDLAEVDRLLDALGWRVGPEAPARRLLADALGTLRELGRDTGPGALEPYARLADELASYEVGVVAPADSRIDAVEAAVVGTVVFEAVLIAFRRLAHEHHSARRIAADGG